MLQGLMVGVRDVMRRRICEAGQTLTEQRSSTVHSPILYGKPIACSLFLLLAAACLPALAADAKDGNASKFVKIANDGNELPDSATLGTNAKDWACTRDTTTGLIWEVKANSGLRSKAHTFTWYSNEAAGRAVGVSSGGTCESSGRCDTEKYVADVNSAGLCGASDWRMPQSKELEGVIGAGLAAPAIAATYFPNTTNTYYWSGTPGAYYSFSAWAVYVSDAQSYYFHRSGSIGVRLVRKGK